MKSSTSHIIALDHAGRPVACTRSSTEKAFSEARGGELRVTDASSCPVCIFASATTTPVDDTYVDDEDDDRPALGSSFMEHPRCWERRGSWSFDFEHKRLILALRDVWGANDPGLFVFFDENGELYPKSAGGTPLEIGRSTAIERPVLSFDVPGIPIAFATEGARLKCTVFDIELKNGRFNVNYRYDPTRSIP
jgi:hypothetical protein